MLLRKQNSNTNSNKNIILTNVFWAMLGKVTNMASALFVGILVARYLGPSQYGLMNYVISYITLFTVISNFGLDDIEIRELSRTPQEKESILGTCFRLRLIFSTIAFLLVVITLILFRTDKYSTYMILAYSLTLYTGSFNIIRNYFTSILKNEYIVKLEISRTLIGGLIKIILLWIKAPLELFIFAAVFDTILIASGYCLSYKKTVGNIKDWKYEKKIIHFYLKESFPLVLSGAAVIIYQRIDQVIIGNLLNNESVGYFATASKFVDLILFLPLVLTQTITPLLIRIKETDLTLYSYKKQQFISIVVWISIILSIAVSSFSYFLIYYTYGEKYLPAVPVLQILAFKTIGMAFSVSSGQIIIIERIQKWAFIRNILGCIICVILNLIFIPRWGVIGSAWVTLITISFTGFIANLFIPQYHSIFKIQLYSLVCGWKFMLNIKNLIKQ